MFQNLRSMYSRKIEDRKRAKRIWWVEADRRWQFEKNRKKCSCPMCGNPRRYKLDRDSPTGIKEHALKQFQLGEITEYILDSQTN